MGLQKLASNMLVTHEKKVCLIGSGNWASTIAMIVGQNVAKFEDFDNEIKMWVFEEDIDGKKLTSIINTKHENVKYLPGHAIPANVIATSDMEDVVTGADYIIICLPHQFVKKTCTQMKSFVKPSAVGISLVKGFEVTEDGAELMTDVLEEMLKIQFGVLSGANIANEVAKGQFCEATVAFSKIDQGLQWKKLFDTSFFHVNVIKDVKGPQVCGALKNVVAIAAGIISGLQYGDNTKAAIMRIGLMEIRKYCHKFYDGIEDETFFESCGVADLITTCNGGRNRKAGQAMVQQNMTIEQIEAELLGGQKLQGTLTAREVYQVLRKANQLNAFPLFTTVYKICYEQLSPRMLVNLFNDIK
eukprot:NODE_99_length_20944_cov_0.552746.p3 type:complete len:358 gc:universal NODE_99_length_20944_cov_0.552746:10827-11900(+)